MSTEEKNQPNPENTSGDKSGEKGGDNNRKPRRRRRSRKPATAKKNTQQQSWTPAMFKVAPAEGKRRFHDFNLPDVLLHAIADQGFQYCTPIQAETIVPALEGRDIIGKAQTGTGKTAAFLIGIITDLLDFGVEGERKLAEPRALIIAPTRELALQIASDAEGLCRYAGLNVVSLVGGMDYDGQRKQLSERPVDILVATPGRLIDFVRGKEVDLYNIEVLVLDEADRMLSMGFIPDVRTIIRQTPRKGPERQTLLYSATFTEDVMRLARQWTMDAVHIEIESEHKTTDNVSQTVFLVSSHEKYQLLINYLRVNGIERAIVFCNRRHETRSLAEKLRKDGLRAALMSGEIPQNKRLKTLEDFRSGKIQVLVATDVAGRGIHIDGVTHVINYQLPDDADDYVHRIGRTGRAGATGTSICFACEDDSFMIPQVEEETGVKLECVHPDPELLKPLEKETQPHSEAEKLQQDEVSEAVSEADTATDSEAAAEAEISTIAATETEAPVAEHKAETDVSEIEAETVKVDAVEIDTVEIESAVESIAESSESETASSEVAGVEAADSEVSGSEAAGSEVTDSEHVAAEPQVESAEPVESEVKPEAEADTSEEASAAEETSQEESAPKQAAELERQQQN
ncbi:ATP-dependent RNA helicase RhlB [Marinobacterium lutimaris]|uniref:ATP-dependent RNA helicase RhlB n=1 Tax=Marinobacterium lutimaris TaxID=568106 RepID=A0A1H5UN71_9GAMM|nr:ATP-dependent RNA helicase RhlB [Marinobacterium lutimaris]